MADKVYPQSKIPIRKTLDLLPQVFKTDVNDKFLSGTIDALTQPGVLEKTVGYIGRRYGKTFKGNDVYLDTDQTLRSRYQLEPGVVINKNNRPERFYDYIDFKNQLRFFGNYEEKDKDITDQEHYTWNPPVDWDKFVNYREYFWVPAGPPAVFVQGQAQNIVSTYRVDMGDNKEWILTPDGLTPNPTITLYRGQTYKFQVRAPGHGFVIRSVYDVGSLAFNPILSYSKGQLVLFDEKLWRAKVNIPSSDGSTITSESEDWELVETATQTSALDYNQGITNNGIENGTLTFTVPLDAPDVLFYQSKVSPDSLGRFIIADIESNTFIDIEKEVLGKKTYTSSNNIEFTNGLAVRFTGQVAPEYYSDVMFIVEGVGKAIKLVKFDELVVSPDLNLDAPEVLFDNTGFDTDPFDDAAAYPAKKDYITVNRSSPDNNPWSRYNRWFHRSALEYAHNLNDSSFDSSEAARAKRPIIEFDAGLQLFNHGARAKATVDYIDDFTADVFSTIEGSLGYNVDGEQLFEGARILATADTDTLVKNKIYVVAFIRHNNRTQITLREAEDSVSVAGDCVLIRRGNKNKGKMYHFDGESWIKSQEKTAVNQPPKFDVFDDQGVSYSDPIKYPISTFSGTETVSYKIGNSVIDSELGFSLSYQNINNVGDIEFEFDFDTESFNYQINQIIYSKKLNSGFLKLNEDAVYSNCWTRLDKTYIMPIIDSAVVGENFSEVVFETIDWEIVDQYEMYFYLNGEPFKKAYTRTGSIFKFDHEFIVGDTVSVKIFGDVSPDKGYYEIPAGLERNPLNQEIAGFTLGVAQDHISSSLEFEREFVGIFPGNCNLRDLSEYKNRSKRFLKHAGLPVISLALLCDKENNIIKSLQFSKKSYSDFKNNFIKTAEKLRVDKSIPDFVDDILVDLSKTKNASTPFFDSDMVGTGAYNSIDYVVEDVGIKTFALSKNFNLETLTSEAVYVYVNDQQLLHLTEYTFDSTFGFIRLSVDLIEGDRIQIREYLSSSFCFIPATPTKIGVYKKYTPRKFLDDTYQIPKEVIQGHDGSITIAYGDFRDDLLLELEYRIYNNIKQQYDENIFDIDKTISSFYGYGSYLKSQLDNIVSREFLKWLEGTNVDYKNNLYFDEQDSFTYTYNNMTDVAQSANLPGWWRGVYQWFYDTDRPHTCPWEMLGFSEQPEWWEAEYGPAPYTRNNLILWEDLRDGIIRKGPREGTHERYSRSTLISHIPTDEDGRLLSPLDSGLAQNFALVNSRGPFKIGDIAPAESAWRKSSEYPYAVIIAMSLMKPFEFITDNLDRSKVTTNILNQTINKDTRTFLKKEDILIPTFENKTCGLINFVNDYLKSKNISPEVLQDLIYNIDLRLSSRISGFVDQNQQKYILDSRSPQSTSGNVFVPPENYDILFSVSSPITSVAYSGVLIEKTDRGWKVDGYDDLDPYFNYYQAVSSQTDPLITVGGISEKFVEWSSGKFYGNGVVARYQNEFYRSLKSHDSGENFDTIFWKKLPQLPLTGGVEALRRLRFNTLVVRQVSYGTVFPTVQSVVDFLLGYEFYLRSQGVVFNGYDMETQTARDFTTACKEFMFWTRQNWEIGSLLTLSPCAAKVEINHAIGVADNILDSFYDYQVKKSNGQPLSPKSINVKRDFQNTSVEVADTNEGIYFLRLYFVLKEHIVLFSDRTVFNDVIYDKPTGYRQERIKSRGFRTVDWDGDYTSPGFIFDNVNIEAWQPFVDYRLGDIISYKSYNWVSLINQEGKDFFNSDNWSKLDSTPTKSLIANFDYKINQFEDYFDLDSNGVGTGQKDLGRHFTGYQPREYLASLSEDEVTQYKLYQGFIREKGTENAINKVFDKLSQRNESVTINEEWAIRVGRLGGINQLREIEFRIDKNNLRINPQPIIIQESVASKSLDRYLRINSSDFVISETPFNKNINILTTEEIDQKTPGYVNINQIDHTVGTRDDILDLDISTVLENQHVWVTFDSPDWAVLRLTELPLLTIERAVKDGSTVSLEFGRTHGLVVDDIIGIKDLVNLTGFFKIVSVSSRSVDIEVADDAEDPELDSTLSRISVFVQSRFTNYQEVDPRAAALLRSKSKLFIDKNEIGQWEVVEKNIQYIKKNLIDYGISDPRSTGTSVIYIESLKQIVSSIPGSGYLMAYIETPSGLGLKQIIAPPTEFVSGLKNSFGYSIAVSPDNRFMFVGTPLASGIKTFFKGLFQPNKEYRLGDIVLENGRLWQAQDNFRADGSSIDVYSDNWKPAILVEASSVAEDLSPEESGIVTIYEWADQQWNLRNTIMSPRVELRENFGHSISLSKNGNTYYAAISAPGANDNRGRVYLFSGNSSGVWSHLENVNYVGIYDATLTGYPAGSIVWWDGSLWQANQDILSDGSTLPALDSVFWTKLDDISTSCSLPNNRFIDDDGSTLSTGLLSETELRELTKAGDRFGQALAMNRDGSILVVGGPNSDDEYFANFRGYWSSTQEYRENDVVKHDGGYFKLTNTGIDVDSSIEYTSINENPASDPWVSVGDSVSTPTGKIFIYQRNEFGRYELKQTISAGSIEIFSDIDESLSSGDLFGYSVDIDSTGTTIVAASPQADINGQNQGSVYIFKTAGMSQIEYRLKQKLESFENQPNEFFGSSVSISPGTEKIAVGAKNAPQKLTTVFDNGDTTFDELKTAFKETLGYTGQVYVFERKDQGYFLGEKLEADLLLFESFGYSIDCSSNFVVVGSPDYTVDGIKIGNVRLFKKDNNKTSFEVLSSQTPLVDLEKIKSVEMYDDINNVKLGDIDFVDHRRLKILGTAEQEISFKLPYDPAIYNVGTENQIVDSNQTWYEKNVGKIWWDISTAKWIDYEQGDIAYRTGNWNRLVDSASVDIYEWIETPLLPSEWSALADTTDGLSQGISGQPLYPDDDVYSIKQIFSSATGLPTGTLYYYWVKNKNTLPNNPERRITAQEVYLQIANPVSSGVPFMAFIAADQLLAYNFDRIIAEDYALLNIQYYKSSSRNNQIHNEYQLITEGVADSLPAEKIERKWIDSLVGYDSAGNQIPDPSLKAKHRYGIEYRPRQGMFINRIEALKITIDRINNVLKNRSFSENLSLTNLILKDNIPSEQLNFYDISVDSFIDLQQVGTVRIKQAILSANIVDGRIDTIDVINSGFGYRNPPPIVISGDGQGAYAEAVLDNQGRISSVNVISKGKKYNYASATVRPYSVLVRFDETSNNYWTIYSWDQQRSIFYRSRSQGFDVTKYWDYIDWWKEGYGPESRIVKEIAAFYIESSIEIQPGDLLKVKEYGSGGWAILLRTEDGQGELLGKYTLVGRQNGTIKISDRLYSPESSPIGFDYAGSYDVSLYDLQPTTELRIILDAIKNDIFVDDLRVEWNKLFFAGIRFAFSEQLYIDWSFKTSFLNAIHNIGDLQKKTTYKNDSLDSFKEYLKEVKPYRSTIREYTSLYTELQPTESVVTDFDLPPTYSASEGKIIPVNLNNEQINDYPWKWWLDNLGYSIIEILISDGGTGYTDAPRVLIDGNGTGARAEAFINNGRVSGIRVISQGYGYTNIPTVSLVGGNGFNNRTAKAVAILGDSKARTFDLTVKFDRLDKRGIFDSSSKTETFIAPGRTATFDLSFASTLDKSKIQIKKNNIPLLGSDYSIRLYKSNTDTYSLIKAKLILNLVPGVGDIIEITYDKNDELFDSVNRIEKYYNPRSGMKGNNLNQLMTGIDFGGVQVQATTFDVTGGWDALPWFTDGWDSVENNTDFYVVVDGSTTFIQLPRIPDDGEIITIYLQRNGEDRAVRIDDLYYLDYDGSTIQPNGRTTAPENALMPTFVGDGSTSQIEIGEFVRTFPGDTLIFRNINSDGSVEINDENIIDTKIRGGSFENIGGAYSTANGLSAEDISLDGGNFISPDQVPAPEENIPGQVLDSVSIKVFSSIVNGASPLQLKVYPTDGIKNRFSIGLSVLDSSSIIVYLDKVKQEYSGDNIDYSIDFRTNEIEFVSTPSTGQLLEIVSIGIGGASILDYQEFISDGETNFFLCSANYQETRTVYVTVNGEYVDVGYANSSEFLDVPNRVLVRFGTVPESNQVIKIICVGSVLDADSTGQSIVRVNQQTFIYDGSTRNYDLDRFVNLSRGSAISSILVNLNNVQLNNVDTINQVYDGTNNQVIVGIDPDEPVGTITSSNIKVYVNGNLLRFVIDYTFDGNQNLVNINLNILSIGDVIRVETDVRADYFVNNNNIVLSDSLSLTAGDEIEITWFGEYPTMDTISDQFTGGQKKYKLQRNVLSSAYVWVYKNGQRLSLDKDYYVDTVRSSVYLLQDTEQTDLIKIVYFSADVFAQPSAYEIYKDMFNVYHYHRYSSEKNVLTKDLRYYDQEIEVSDGSLLPDPIRSRNVPGIVSINGEKIHYLEKQGNILRQLRRGVQGTPIKELHSVDSDVINLSYTESIPYNEIQQNFEFISDGSTILIGPLEFVPAKSNRSNWIRETIPTEYGACDIVEVFVSGRRLRKDWIQVYDNNISASSPSGDIVLEAEFSVDGTNPYIRLTEAIPEGTVIKIIRKTGQTWQERGTTSITTGKSLLSNDTPIAKFIRSKTTRLPE